MKEHVLRVDLADIRLSVILFEDAFCVQSEKDPILSLSNLKALHQHSFYEIFWVSRGSFSVVTEQKSMTSENSLLILPPFLDHYTAGSDFEVYGMYFTVSPLPNKQERLYDRVIKTVSEGITELSLTEDERFYVEHIAQCLSGKQSMENIQYLLQLLFSEIFYRMQPQAEEAPLHLGKRSKYINAIEVYISHHYCEEIRLSDIADALYLCTKQVTRIIRKEYGCSFSELVTHFRLNTACMMLKHTTLSVKDVAANVGYRDHENYFFTLFRKRYGVTPTQYREKLRQGDLGDENHEAELQ